MSSTTSMGVVLIAFHIVGVLCLASSTAWFLHGQLASLGGLKGAASNQFVVTAAVGNSALILDFVLFIIGYVLSSNSALSLSYFAFAFAMGCHVRLVYMRSRAVFEYRINYVRILNVMVLAFYGGVFFTALFAMVSDANPSSLAALGTFLFLLLLSALLLAVIDVVSTISFALHVQRVKLMLADSQAHMSGSENHLQQTNLIARRGVMICLGSALNLLLFVIFRLMISSKGHTVLSDTIYIFDQACVVAVMTSWMFLKTELDAISKTWKLQAANQSDCSERCDDLPRICFESSFVCHLQTDDFKQRSYSSVGHNLHL
eukprot:TRINITY_DN3935_c0_g1_i1.p1 TRINITY_DN3935_c0_g1~~TRINITY_DN3935_c0_g1_i1.p1  ORF type:complete len:333 (-),score=69.48 TRINITY_DN3935_c0_g1_i1:16-966(-)